MDLKAFQQQIFPLSNKLFRFANSILKSREEAEDAVQEVMIKLWSGRKNLDEIKNLDAWCMKVTRNWCYDKLKASKSRIVDISNLGGIESQELKPDKLAEQKDSAGRIHRIIEKLPENQRMVVRLREIEEYSYKEIAEVLDMSMDAVKVNLFRARQTIKDHYRELEQHEKQN